MRQSGHFFNCFPIKSLWGHSLGYDKLLCALWNGGIAKGSQTSPLTILGVNYCAVQRFWACGQQLLKTGTCLSGDCWTVNEMPKLLS